MYPSIIHEWFEEVWNRGNTAAVYKIVAKDCLFHHLDEAGNDAHGPDEFLVFFRRLRNAFPDMHVVVHDALVGVDKEAGRWTVTGTHSGDALGPVAATGNPINLEGMSFSRIENGKVVEAWNVWDTHAMVEQLSAPLGSGATAG